MNSALNQWLLAGHVFTFMAWTGTLFASLHILAAHAKAGADPNDAFTGLERATGIAMDAFATLAMLFGVLLIVVPENGTELFRQGGFFHAKLTFVGVVIALHTLVRIKMRHFRNGKLDAPAGWMFPVASISVLAIVIMMEVRPF